jgi:hypothetical protein
MESIDKYINFLKNNDINQEQPLNNIPEIFQKPIPPIREWINNKYFIGKSNIFDFWKDKLITFYNEDKRECIVTGGTRSGKTFYCNLIIERDLHELIYEFYQTGSVKTKFGLDDSSPISIKILSKTIKETHKTTFAMLRNMLRKSPFIREYGQHNYQKNESLEFLDGRIIISVGSADEGSILSTDLFVLLLDESNFLKNSHDDSFATAMNIYSEAVNRIKQTFTVKGKSYGHNILASSVNTMSSFIESRIKDKKDDEETMIILARNFEIRPDEYSKERFYTFIGNKNSQPFVINLENKEKWIDILTTLRIDNLEEFINYNNITEVKIPEEMKTLVTEAPIDFYKSAKNNILHFLKEVCGISIGDVGDFFNNLIAFNDCINDNLKHPFLFEQIEVSTENAKKRNELIDALSPIFLPLKDKSYAVTLDASKSSDSTGFTMGYYDDATNKVIIVLQLKILPPKNPLHKIRYQTIIDFIKFLKYKRGFNIRMFRCDTYQSESFLQPLSELGIDCGTISVEKDIEYITFRTLILEGRVEFYNYLYFKKELFALVHDIANRKIDHTSKGSKDISDSNCRLVSCLVKKYDNLTEGVGETLKALIESRKKGESKSLTVEEIIKMEEINFQKSMGYSTHRPESPTMSKLLNIITRR